MGLKIIIIFLLMCSLAYAKPTRLKSDNERQQKVERIEKEQELLSDEAIDNLSSKETKEYLKKITEILRTLLNQ